jgi:hypothetical protein
MILIVFAVVALVGQVLNVLFCLAVESLISSETVGGLLFVALYLFVFAGAWKLSVYIVERMQGPAAEPAVAPRRSAPEQEESQFRHATSAR